MSEPMQGKRIRPRGKNMNAKPGQYGKHPVDGRWYGCTPNGLLAGLALHSVTEHPDGTITVAPSIEVKGAQGYWHGYLERGVWRDA